MTTLIAILFGCLVVGTWLGGVMRTFNPDCL
jgi:hypothetical protein